MSTKNQQQKEEVKEELKNSNKETPQNETNNAAKEPADQNQQPTAEQIREYQKRMKAHYDAELPFLRKWAEYERLRAEVVESQLKRITYERQLAMAQAPPPTSKELMELAEKRKAEENKAAETAEATKNKSEGPALQVIKEEVKQSTEGSSKEETKTEEVK